MTPVLRIAAAALAGAAALSLAACSSSDGTASATSPAGMRPSAPSTTTTSPATPSAVTSTAKVSAPAASGSSSPGLSSAPANSTTPAKNHTTVSLGAGAPSWCRPIVDALDHSYPSAAPGAATARLYRTEAAKATSLAGLPGLPANIRTFFTHVATADSLIANNGGTKLTAAQNAQLRKYSNDLYPVIKDVSQQCHPVAH